MWYRLCCGLKYVLYIYNLFLFAEIDHWRVAQKVKQMERETSTFCLNFAVKCVCGYL